MINYPQRTPVESLEAALAENLRYQNPNAHIEVEAQTAKQKPSSQSPSARQTGGPPNQQQKPEDKDSPEYKKKVALQTLPILETKNNATSYGMSETLFTSLKDIFESVVGSQSRIGIIRPEQFLEVLRREHEMFRTAMHQDAHEFLNLLLNEVVSNVETVATKETFEKSLPPTDSEDSLGPLTGSSGSKSPNTTRWVHELFEGTLTSETRCLTCENVSQRDEVFLDLSVDLEQHSSVTSCLRKFSEEEMLCERNKFHCDNCGGLQEAEKRMKIKRLPRVLALHLKRFKYTEDLQRLQKLFHRVVYPYHLRLFNTTDDAEDPDRLYELYAVVIHIGGGPYHGHYVAIIKTEDRGWLLFDDELVEPVDRNFVRNFFGDRPGLACAYVLFYQETTLEAVLQEQAQENQASAAAASETGDVAGNLNGLPLSPGLAHVHSASNVPSEDTHRFVPVNRTPSAPPLSTHSETPELAASVPGPTLPSLPSIPDTPAPAPAPTPKKSDVQSRKERAREKQERRAAEKERERQEKIHRRDIEMQRRREAADLKTALELSKAEMPPELDPENGSMRKSSGFGFLKRGSRSLSSRLVKENKELRTSTPDLTAGPVPEVPPEVPPLKETDPVDQPAVDVKDIGSISNPKMPSRAPEPKEDPPAKRGHTPRWRSFSFKKS